MSTTVAEVLKAALKLTPEERAELVDSLWDTLPDLSLEMDPEFLAEINRRSDEIDAGTAVGRPWSEFRKELLAELDKDV